MSFVEVQLFGFEGPGIMQQLPVAFWFPYKSTSNMMRPFYKGKTSSKQTVGDPFVFFFKTINKGYEEKKTTPSDGCY